MYSDACVQNKQLYSKEKGFFFFRGLLRADKEAILLYILDGPNGDNIEFYNLKEIYKYLYKLYR